MTTRWAADVGVLAVENDSVRFDGKRHLSIRRVLGVARVHSRAFAHDLLQLDYADGNEIATVYFAAAYRRGGGQTIDQLFVLLKALADSGEPGSIEPQELEKHRQKVEEGRSTSNRQAATSMWIGAAVFFTGLVVTVATFAMANVAGGTYIVAYGAVLGGLALFLKGYASRQK